MKKEYLVRFGSNSQAKIVELNDDQYRQAINWGYQIIPLETKKP